jgi:aminoglycoside phosphotransferase (APT) family kinase protein
LFALISRLRQACSHAFWPSLELEAMEEWLNAWLRDQAGSRLGLGSPPPWTAHPVGGGRNTLVRRLALPGGETYFVRTWRYDLCVRPAREHAVVAELMDRTGLRVPEILLRDDSPGTRRRYRLETVVERAAPGRPLNEVCPGGGGRMPPDLTLRVAGELAALHHQGSPCAGKPWRPNNLMANPRRYWRGRLRKYAATIPAHTLKLDPDALCRTIERMEARIDSLCVRPPVLVHGDLSPAHLFVDGRMRITWIDFGTVHYGHPAVDLAALRHWFRDPEGFDRFMGAYARAQGEDGPEMRRAMDLFDRIRMLEKLRTRIVKRTRRAQKLDPRRLEQITAEQMTVEMQLRPLLEK